MKQLLKLFAACAAAGLLPAAIATAKPSESELVKKTIDKVNQHWQATNAPETRSFWDNAVYHTGNMEAYFLTGNRNYLDYTVAWADHNRWKGAKSDNRSEWKYSYGESDEYVLFGDYQICFQVYADLYGIEPENYKIERAKEVMEYQMSTPNNDYWWWSDALYMAMPVMTKMYKTTGNGKYLDKLYEYISYSDSIMFDKEENLYYRDAKYVYPKHKTANGKKDFWARGDAWVVAGLAKVLQDLPAEYERRTFFADKFRNMAKAVAALQQPEGYWTRSMTDPAFAPGPETSGTALFMYGLTWGINNGYIEKETYLPVVEKAWKYLSETAVQKDGTVGYVQPIGEKAVPGQVINAKSTANFGVGAFLLAACEYALLRECGQNHAERPYLLVQTGIRHGCSRAGKHGQRRTAKEHDCRSKPDLGRTQQKSSLYGSVRTADGRHRPVARPAGRQYGRRQNAQTAARVGVGKLQECR